MNKLLETMRMLSEGDPLLPWRGISSIQSPRTSPKERRTQRTMRFSRDVEFTRPGMLFAPPPPPPNPETTATRASTRRRKMNEDEEKRTFNNFIPRVTQPERNAAISKTPVTAMDRRRAFVNRVANRVGLPLADAPKSSDLKATQRLMWQNRRLIRLGAAAHPDDPLASLVRRGRKNDERFIANMHLARKGNR